jgi:hypothetical protein
VRRRRSKGRGKESQKAKRAVTVGEDNSKGNSTSTLARRRDDGYANPET